MDNEWICARLDGSDLRVGDQVRLVNGCHIGRGGIVIGMDPNHVIGDRFAALQNRTGLDYRWQYHAPTRAKLVEVERAALAATETTFITPTSAARAKPIGEVSQPQAPPDDEPGWNHVPYERVGDSGGLKTSVGDRFFASGMWHPVCVARDVRHPDTLLRRASHPERVRWLEERNRVVNTDSAIVTREDARDATDAVPVDPFAAVRAEAKRMMDDGADPRLVLGALDECVRRKDPTMWKLQLAYHTVEATKSIARRFTRTQFEPCYHGNRAGSCGWCMISRERSDARIVASSEPAWDTADCEGE